MAWKRKCSAAALALAVGTLVTIAAAEEPTPPSPAEPQSPAAPQPPAEENVGFWGDRFALFVEFAAGQSQAQDIEADVVSSAYNRADNTLSLNDNDFGEVAVGWQLPYNRGHFLVVFNGHKENSYEYQSQGIREFAQTGGNLEPFVATWWTVRVADGKLQSSLTIPQQVRDVDPSVPADFSFTVDAPSNLRNVLQTYDALYQREFGGRRYSGRWSTGLRYFVYEGNLPVGAWLIWNARESTGHIGFTDGSLIRLMPFYQKTDGLGPTGSAEAQFNFFRKRLQFYAEARAAYILANLTVDSGDFYALTYDNPSNPTPQVAPTPERLRESVDKNVWNLGVRLGARYRIVEGLTVDLGFSRVAYQDVLIRPMEFTLADNWLRAKAGVTARYRTDDLILDTIRLGFGYQF